MCSANPVLSDDPWNRWPDCNLPGDLPHSIYLTRLSGSMCANRAHKAVHTIAYSPRACINTTLFPLRYTSVQTPHLAYSPEALRVGACSLGNHILLWSIMNSVLSLPAEWLMKKRSLHGGDIWNVTKMPGCSHRLWTVFLLFCLKVCIVTTRHIVERKYLSYEQLQFAGLQCQNCREQ